MLRRVARNVVSSEGGAGTAAVGTVQVSHYLDYRMALSPDLHVASGALQDISFSSLLDVLSISDLFCIVGTPHKAVAGRVLWSKDIRQ